LASFRGPGNSGPRRVQLLPGLVRRQARHGSAGGTFAPDWQGDQRYSLSFCRTHTQGTECESCPVSGMTSNSPSAFSLPVAPMLGASRFSSCRTRRRIPSPAWRSQAQRGTGCLQNPGSTWPWDYRPSIGLFAAPHGAAARMSEKILHRRAAYGARSGAPFGRRRIGPGWRWTRLWSPPHSRRCVDRRPAPKLQGGARAFRG